MVIGIDLAGSVLAKIVERNANNNVFYSCVIGNNVFMLQRYVKKLTRLY